MNTSRSKLSRSAQRRATRQTSRRSSAFTLIELLVVIAIIALLAGLVVGGTRYTGAKMKESRIRTEMQALETAIEAYHARFSHYPPDNVNPATKAVDPAANSLYYELTGVIVQDDPRAAGGTFRTPNRSDKFGQTLVKKYFGVDGIENAATTPKEIKSFLPQLKSGQYAALNPKAAGEAEMDVLVVHVPWPTSRSDQPTPVPGLNPWRYNSTAPTNNPASFDLWAEYVEGGKVRVICNWSKDILEQGQ